MTSENTQDVSWCWFWIFKVLYYRHDKSVRVHLCGECRRSNEPSVCHKLESICDSSRKFVDWPRMSGPPIRVTYKHFKTICEHTLDNSPTDFISSSLKWWSSFLKLWSSKHELRLYVLAQYFCWPVRNSFSTHFFALPSMSCEFLREVCPILVIFQLR